MHKLVQNARQLPSLSTDCKGNCNNVANRRLHLTYAFDENGNVSGITDGTSTARQTRSMSYDGLDRLTGTTSPMFGTASYGYDAKDNLTQVNVTGGNHSRNHWYCYNANSQLSFIRSGPQCTGNASPAVTTLSYDVQGNLATKNSVGFTFDYGNRLRSDSTGQSYRYDAQGRRVKQDTAGAQQRYSFYANDGRLVWQRDEVTGQRIHNLYFAGSLVAEFSRPIGGDAETIAYQHTDALGSPIARTNASKALIETSEYEPYGALVNRNNNDRAGYTGHVMDSATGMTYMQQRYFDSQLGIFGSVDPVTAYSKPIGAFNRYKYAANNPYRFLDPDGRYECTATGKGQCARLEKAVARIHKAAEKAPEGSRVAQVSQLLGAPGQKNGVVISGQLADPKNLGETTSVDGKGIHIGLNFGKLKTGDQLASVTMHEGSHGVDQRDPNLGPRMRDVSRSALEVSELKASTAQARMFEALKANEPYKLFTVDGGMNWKGINEQADRSVEWACPNKNSCNP